MKRYLTLALFVLLCASWPCHALITGYSRGSGSTCMSGTYLFAWTGEHTSGTDFACDGASNPLDGTVIGAPVFGIGYGEGSPDVGIRSDAVNEYLSFADSGGAIVDINGAQTVWMRIYVSATPTATTRLFQANYDASNFINIVISSTNRINGFHRIGATQPYALGDTAIANDAWVDVAYSWDFVNKDHSVNSDGTWDDDLDELSATEGPDITSIRVGTYNEFSMPASEYIQVTKIAVVAGYKAAKPW